MQSHGSTQTVVVVVVVVVVVGVVVVLVVYIYYVLVTGVVSQFLLRSMCPFVADDRCEPR